MDNGCCFQPSVINLFQVLKNSRQSLLTRNRQRRYFYYLTGCELPDCYFTYDIAADKSTLFIPPINPEEVVWSGLPMTTEEALKK